MSSLISRALLKSDVYVPFGNVWFVDADNGDDGNSGTSASNAFATIGAAITAASAGDTIYVAPGSYDENVVVDKDYITLIGGFLSGYARPDIVPAAGKALSVEAAQGFVGQHLRFVSVDDDCVLNEGNGFWFQDCVFDGDGNAATDCGLRLKGNADDDSFTASEGIVESCLFRGSGGFGIGLDTGDAPTNGVGCTDNVIRDCRFYGNTAEDIMALDTGGGVYAAQNLLIERCNFASKNKTTYIDVQTNLAAANSGAMQGNWFAADALTTTEVKMVGSGFTFGGNFSNVGVVDGTGLD
jgi:hypothetical protein